MTWLHDGHVATHLTYSMSCDEYIQLTLRAEGRCDRCGEQARDPQIDHDHAVGNWAVRGLLCQRCNLIVELVERGARCGDRVTEQYIEGSFYIAAALTPKGRGAGSHRFKARNYRASDDEYEPVAALIESMGGSMNTLFRAALRRVVDEPSFLDELTPFMEEVAAETPRGRPKRKAPPAE